MRYNVTVTPVPLELVPVPWWRRLWLMLLRRPMPTRCPEGTRPIKFEQSNGVVIFIPAARVEYEEAPL